MPVQHVNGKNVPPTAPSSTPTEHERLGALYRKIKEVADRSKDGGSGMTPEERKHIQQLANYIKKQLDHILKEINAMFGGMSSAEMKILTDIMKAVGGDSEGSGDSSSGGQSNGGNVSSGVHGLVVTLSAHAGVEVSSGSDVWNQIVGYCGQTEGTPHAVSKDSVLQYNPDTNRYKVASERTLPPETLALAGKFNGVKGASHASGKKDTSVASQQAQKQFEATQKLEHFFTGGALHDPELGGKVVDPVQIEQLRSLAERSGLGQLEPFAGLDGPFLQFNHHSVGAVKEHLFRLAVASGQKGSVVKKAAIELMKHHSDGAVQNYQDAVELDKRLELGDIDSPQTAALCQRLMVSHADIKSAAADQQHVNAAGSSVISKYDGHSDLTHDTVFGDFGSATKNGQSVTLAVEPPDGGFGAGDPSGANGAGNPNGGVSAPPPPNPNGDVSAPPPPNPNGDVGAQSPPDRNMAAIVVVLSKIQNQTLVNLQKVQEQLKKVLNEMDALNSYLADIRARNAGAAGLDFGNFASKVKADEAKLKNNPNLELSSLPGLLAEYNHANPGHTMAPSDIVNTAFFSHHACGGSAELNKLKKSGANTMSENLNTLTSFYQNNQSQLNTSISEALNKFESFMSMVQQLINTLAQVETKTGTPAQ